MLNYPRLHQGIYQFLMKDFYSAQVFHRYDQANYKPKIITPRK